MASAGPVSETMAAPLGAKATEKVPGAGLALTTMGERVPSGWTWKTSMLVGDALGDDENWPSGLNASDVHPVVVWRRRWSLRSAGVGPPLPGG